MSDDQIVMRDKDTVMIFGIPYVVGEPVTFYKPASEKYGVHTYRVIKGVICFGIYSDCEGYVTLNHVGFYVDFGKKESKETLIDVINMNKKRSENKFGKDILDEQ